MSALRWILILCFCVSTLFAAEDSPLTADQIMARVAANQDQSVELRKNYVYKQHVHVVTHKTNGRLMRDETAEYDVLPAPDGATKKLESAQRPLSSQRKVSGFSG